MNRVQVEQMVKEGKSLAGANLTGADLTRAVLRRATLHWANLTGADLRGADLTGAYLTRADLRGADLRGADFTAAVLTKVDLTGADLTGATLPDFRVCPEEGEFIAWKKTMKGVIRLLVPADATRVNAIGSRKCRASKVIVLGGPGCGGSSPTRMEGTLVYAEGAEVVAPEFSDDIRAECAPGIHFFITKKEAEEW